jgi:hypothetical protein
MSASKNATVASVENLLVSLKATVVEALFQDYPGTWLAVSRLMACARFCRIRKFVLLEVRGNKKKPISTLVNRQFSSDGTAGSIYVRHSRPPPSPLRWNIPTTTDCSGFLESNARRNSSNKG